MATEEKATDDGCCSCKMNNQVYSPNPIFHHLPGLRNGNATQATMLAWAVKFHTVTPKPRVTAERNLKRMTCD